MPKKVPLVLVVDDHFDIIHAAQEKLARHGVDSISATTLEELDGLFDANMKDISVIILDACLDGGHLNTIEFVQRVRRKGFSKPIIAASEDKVYREFMVHRGCSHQSEKHRAAQLALELLGMSSTRKECVL